MTGHLGGRRRPALLAGVMVAATGAMLAPAQAQDLPFVVDRVGAPDFGWAHYGCSDGLDRAGDLPIPVDGPPGVPNGAGSLQVSATDDTYAEFDLPPVQDAAALTSYPVTLSSPDGVLRIVAGVQPPGDSTTFLLATVPVPAYSWQTLDLADLTFEHMSDDHVHWWGGTVDDSGTLAHFVGEQSNVRFRPAVAVLGCDEEGGIGTHLAYLDRSGIEGGPGEIYAGTIEHEPTTAPTPRVRTPKPVTITAGRAATLATRLSHAYDYPMADQVASLQKAAPGSATWTGVADRSTAADGTASATVKPLVNTSYRWSHPQDAFGYFLDAVSDRTEVTVRTRVDSSAADSTVRLGRVIRVTGRLTPAPPAGTRVTLWRWSGSHQRLDRATVAKNGSFEIAVTARRTGTWPLRVTVPRTATNAAGQGAVLEVRVRR